MFRELPGISQCQLWQDLSQRPPSSLPPLALVTDVGNDLLYGASVDQIIEWLETCFDRLAGYGAELVLTLLPTASVLRLPPWRYYVCRSILFPFHWTPWPETIQLVHDLDARLRIVGNRYGAQLVEPRGEWYGFDPIHIRRRCRVQAWREILSRWPSSNRLRRRHGNRSPAASRNGGCDRPSVECLAGIRRLPSPYLSQLGCPSRCTRPCFARVNV